MNFIVVSPNFPETFRFFSIRLHENGVNVLGIGDAPYDELHPELRAALTEYYRVDSMENYDAMFRAVAYFTFHYGKIDWLESNNEYWLEQDAALRTAFNITTGPKSHEIGAWKSKLAMKEFYRRAKVPTARYCPVTTLADAEQFIAEVGYPVIVKPDNGVGAGDTRRIKNDRELAAFFADLSERPYIMEEYVCGEVTTYDGVVNADGEVLFAASHITPNSIMDMVNEGVSTYYYVDKTMPRDVERIGKATLKAFGVRRRFFHLEFFRLTADKAGLGKVGDLVGLEVNMRPAGGYTTEMLNYSQSTDVYQIWADMVAFNERRHTYTGEAAYCVYTGRRDSDVYALTDEALYALAGKHAQLFCRMPRALAGAMGDRVAICCYDDKRDMERFIHSAFLSAESLRPE